MRLLSILFMLFALSFAACNDSESENEPDMTEDMAVEDTEIADANYTITPFSNSTPYPDAKINDMVYKGAAFEFPYTGTDYKLGVQTPDADSKMCANSGKGQHIHLIVDNEPYAAKYENKFDYELENGEHHILAFLSRSYHESIKTDVAFIAEKVNVENGSFTSSEKIEEPMLFYSRPKGTYVGSKETDKVMLDFYIVNLTLGSDFKVKVEINGEEEKMIDVWQPYYLEGLPMGDNKVKLTLVDGSGNIVDTPLNPVERVFTLKEDKGENMGMQ